MEYRGLCSCSSFVGCTTGCCGVERVEVGGLAEQMIDTGGVSETNNYNAIQMEESVG